MLRGGPHLPTTTSAAAAQKQKKRLSFKEPEIEGPHFPVRRFPVDPRKGSLSIENLSLEDQALQVVQSVGSAFSDLSLQDSISLNYLDTVDSTADNQDPQAEAYGNDCFLREETPYQRNLHLQNFGISTEDQEYLDDLSQSPQATKMRCPPMEMQGSCSDPFRNHIPAEENKVLSSSSAQHQIQLLKYQLEQQSQQTQLALHQVHFLTEQMESECAARRKAQEQNSQLMNQNKELLNHIEKLFQQIEDLEKQIQTLEHEKRVKVPHHDLQGPHQRPSLSFPGPRRLSSDTLPDKPSPMGRGLAPRKTSIASPRQPTLQHKPTATPAANRKSPATSPRPIPTLQQSHKAKEAALHIGDTSPPVVEGGSYTPFGSGWKVKAPAEVHQVEPADRGTGRTRTGSFSSFSRLKPPENPSSKTSQLGISGITNKKYSSSTSDLYNSSAGFQSTKPQGLDDSPPSNKSSISNLNLSAPSKLPRFQPYTGRRSSVTKDADQFSALGKDKFKTAPQASGYNR